MLKRLRGGRGNLPAGSVVAAVALVLLLASCAPQLVVSDDVVVACDAGSPRCPDALVCVVSVGRCLDPASSCVEGTDGDAVPVEDGRSCRRAGADRAVCVAGLCTESRCGDGRVDGAALEVCDSGVDNREGWGVEPACTTTCAGPAPTCGDGVVDAEEVCDDGFRDACGTCNDTCTGPGARATCGDGVVCLEVEACDDGGESDACNVDCSTARCGDGVVNLAAGERCDDGARNSDAYDRGVHCNATCAGPGPFCGDGVTDTTEVCDDAGQSGRCEVTCVAPVCGDGIENAGAGEGCDTAGASLTCSGDCLARAFVDVGAGHTCVIDALGAVRCFGDNGAGQCGAQNPAVVGDPTDTMGGHLAPLPLTGAAVAVAVGRASTCVLQADGAVACFGDASRGATGAGAPVVDVGGSASLLASGSDHACVLRDDGRVVCWGDNARCQLGAGHARATVGGIGAEMGAALVPVDLGAASVKGLFAGDAFTCALLGGANEGRLKCWGDNAAGQLGLGDTGRRGCDAGGLGAALPFVDLPGPVTSLATGGATACAHLRSGAVVCWGSNRGGVLGQGRDPAVTRGGQPLEMGVFMPATPLGSTPVARLARRGGDNHMCAVLRDGGMKCWGTNDAGQLGVEDERDRGALLADLGEALPRAAVPGVVVDVAVGPRRTCAVRADGSLVCWGDPVAGLTNAGLGRPAAFPVGDTPGELGPALLPVPLTPSCGNGVVDPTEVCDDGFTDPCGTCNADCSGAGAGAVCGDDVVCAELEACEPGLAAPSTCTDACRPCVGGACDPVCADDVDVCGDGVVCEGLEVCDVAAAVHAGTNGCTTGCRALRSTLAIGRAGACLLDDGGVVRCFGDVTREQLGQSSVAPVGGAPGDLGRLVAVDLGVHRRVQALVKSGAGDFSCALLSDDSIKCWGDNRQAQLGTGDVVTRGGLAALMGDALPAVDLGTGFVPRGVATGARHACAVSTRGRVKCWGGNDLGQRGFGTPDPVGVAPVELGDSLPILSIGAFVVEVAAGAGHTCARTDDQRVLCWGDHRLGQTGSERSPDLREVVVSSSFDTLVPRAATGIAVGASASCALVAPVTPPDSGLVCWGDNARGQIGIGLVPIGADSRIGDEAIDGEEHPSRAVDFGGPVARDVCLGDAFACALLDSGAVRCWGDGSVGQLGFADLVGVDETAVGDEPGELAIFPDVPLGGAADDVMCGARAACARLVDGRFSCWGDNTAGVLGLERADGVIGSVAGSIIPTLPVP